MGPASLLGAFSPEMLAVAIDGASTSTCKLGDEENDERKDKLVLLNGIDGREASDVVLCRQASADEVAVSAQLFKEVTSSSASGPPTADDCTSGGERWVICFT